ncbi:MAG: 3-hydroxyacyl-CoA dehydrogenase family protein, partial [Micrococcales bacterium]|nr:3-hydroxyacyl-CoA dehydrogenase family protein [Micrococcales bacterium]
MKVAVIGAGVMGPGIAQVMLLGGHDVTLTDVSAPALDSATAAIAKSVTQMRLAGLAGETGEALARLTTSSSLKDALAGAELVIEAVPEVMDVKVPLYAQIDALAGPGAVIASNTSALPLPKMMPKFRPGRFLVAHFFNPPAVVPLVEIVRDEHTDDDVVTWLRGVLEACGKRPIVVNGFVMGFLINRLQSALAREALYLLDRGLVSAADLDVASRFGIGFKTAWQGIFETMDYIGLDTVAHAYAAIFPDLCDSSDVPAIVTEKVAQGKLGLKTGEGFLRY